jgi:proteasome accessory factor A
MAIPKVVGVEQEYAVVLNGTRDFDPVELSFLVVNSYEKATHAIWDYDTESPLLDARGFRREGEETVISSRANYRINNLLINGARFYVDHAHPEYSSPECRTARDAVAVDKAGEAILGAAAAKANEKRGAGNEILILKNNSDHKGNSYGTHENYLVDTRAYVRLFPKYPAYPELTMRVLVPFLVTRQIFCGAGKVGSENGTDSCDYQISQRADFFETIIGGQTTHTRPIVNTRDEPHADKERFSRLHVIIGDGNMSEVSAWLKIGVTQAVLELIEDDQLDFDLTLADPVRALVEISHDTSLKRKVRLKSGAEMTAIEIQRRFLEVAVSRQAGRSETDPERSAVLARWSRVLDTLQSDPMELRSEVDWVIKKHLIERTMARKGLSLRDARVVEMDFRYHDIRRDKSLYYVLEREGAVHRLLDDAAIAHFVTEPPDDTRAYFRSHCLRKYRESISHANWDVLTFEIGEHRERKVPLLDPLKGTREHVKDLLDSSPDAKVLLDKLAQG